MKKIKFAFLLGITILATFQIILLNRDSTSGEQLVKLQTEISAIGRENELLMQKIASSSSIRSIVLKKDTIGLTKQATILSLSAPLPLAQR